MGETTAKPGVGQEPAWAVRLAWGPQFYANGKDSLVYHLETTESVGVLGLQSASGDSILQRVRRCGSHAELGGTGSGHPTSHGIGFLYWHS